MTTTDTLDRLRYQVCAPRVTTAGPCDAGCGRHARGSATCADCLIASLPEPLRGLAGQWRMAQRDAMQLWAEMEERA